MFFFEDSEFGNAQGRFYATSRASLRDIQNQMRQMSKDTARSGVDLGSLGLNSNLDIELSHSEESSNSAYLIHGETLPAQVRQFEQTPRGSVPVGFTFNEYTQPMNMDNGDEVFMSAAGSVVVDTPVSKKIPHRNRVTLQKKDRFMPLNIDSFERFKCFISK